MWYSYFFCRTIRMVMFPGACVSNIFGKTEQGKFMVGGKNRPFLEKRIRGGRQTCFLPKFKIPFLPLNVVAIQLWNSHFKEVVQCHIHGLFSIRWIPFHSDVLNKHPCLKFWFSLFSFLIVWHYSFNDKLYVLSQSNNSDTVNKQNDH